MIGVGNIKVSAEGKTPEQVKAEIMEQVAKQVDTMIGLGNKVHKKEEAKPEGPKEARYVHICADEEPEREGFGVSTEWNGDFSTVMTMLTTAVSQALHNMSNDSDDEYNPDLLLQFIMALIGEYIGMNDEEEGE